MIAAIATGLFFSLRNIVNKYVIENRMRPMAWFYFFTAISVIAFPIISWSLSPIVFPSMHSWFLLIVSSSFGFIGGLVFIYALSLGDLTATMPVLSARPILVLPLSFIILNEFYGIGTVWWILLIVAGAILTTWKEKMGLADFVKNKTLGLIIVTMFLWSMMSITSKPVLQEIETFNYLGWWNLLQAPLLLLFMPFVLNKTESANLKKNLKSTTPYALLECTILYMSLVTIFFATKFSVSLTEALVATQGLFSVIIGSSIANISPKIIAEKHTKWIYMLRIIGAILILIGVYNILI